MFRILFVTALLITIISSVIVIKFTKKSEFPEIVETVPENNETSENNEDNENENIKRKKKKLISFLPINSGTLLMLAGILINIIFSIIDSPYKKPFILMTITLVSEYILMCLYHTHGKKLFKFCAKTFAILSVLEITIFNFPAYHIWFGDYEQKNLNVNDCIVEIGEADIDSEKNTVHVNGKNEVVLTFSEMNTKVGTIHAEIDYLKNTEHVKTVIDISDETSREYRYDIAKTDIIKDQETSEYIPCAFSGNISKMRVKFTGYNDGDEFIVKNISINEDIPFEILYLRIAVIGILAILAYSICSLELFKAPFKEK